MPKVIAFISDIFFQARIGETAKQVGVEFSAASTLEPFLAACNKTDGGPSLILIDLNAGSAPSFGIATAQSPPIRRATGVDALEQLRATGNQTPVVAFLSHVQTDLAARARALLDGNSQVMARSQFTQELPEILGRAKSSLASGA